LNHDGEPEPIAVQIAGGDPESMAEAAKFNVDNGAQIIDINMGCPAKKVCNKAAGSALMKDEALVSDILHAVVEAVDVPVSLKMRTGWAPEHKNAPKIAEIAEQAGIVSLAVHGRTRDCGYKGEVEYHTIRDIKQQANIPVFANGDITSAIKAAEVMDFTGADGVLIGRAAQGQPWIFKQVAHYLETGELLAAPDWAEIESILLEHIAGLYSFYGDYLGVRIARKHVSWYLQTHSEGLAFRKNFNRLESSSEQVQAIRTFFKDKILNKGIAA
jgi:tRNA-dihydrouridine synthase B